MGSGFAGGDAVHNRILAFHFGLPLFIFSFDFLMSIFYDTHAHLGFPDFQPDLSEVVQRAHNNGIAKIITIGTDLAGSRRAIEIADAFPNVYAVVGWHPNHVLEAPEDVRPALRELARHPKVVAIGETGMDYHRKTQDADFEKYKRRQAALFRQQMELAAELGLNCIIHQRDSFEDTLAELMPYAGKIKGVFHCFSESVEAMRRIFADWIAGQLYRNCDIQERRQRARGAGGGGTGTIHAGDGLSVSGADAVPGQTL